MKKTMFFRITKSTLKNQPVYRNRFFQLFIFLLAFGCFIALTAQSRKEGQKLAWPVNTAFGDRAPTISADGNILIFESDRDGSMGSYDLYESYWENGRWSKPVNLTALNSHFYDGLPQLSYDNQTIYFSSNRSLNDSNNKDLDIWVSKRNLQGLWQTPQLVNGINSDRHDSNLHVSFDRSEVYFCSERKGGKGGKDIWKGRWINNKWQELISLAEPINSPKDDCYIQLSASSDVLFLASTRKASVGGWDVFYSIRKDFNSPWQNPLSLGNFINSKEDEKTFFIPLTGSSIYFAQGENDQEDIFELKLPEHLYPTRMIFLLGKILDVQDTHPIGNVKIKMESLSTSPVNGAGFIPPQNFEFISDENTGIYSATLFARQKYKMTIHHADYLSHTEIIDFSNKDKVELLQKDILLSSRPILQKFAGVYFSAGSSALNDEAQIALKLYLEYLMTNSNKKIIITGFADFTGNKAANSKLGLARAESVKSFLVTNGIKENLIMVRFGGALGSNQDFYNYKKLHQYRTVEIKLE